jgi:hypothetical protein
MYHIIDMTDVVFSKATAAPRKPCTCDGIVLLVERALKGLIDGKIAALPVWKLLRARLRIPSKESLKGR